MKRFLQALIIPAFIVASFAVVAVGPEVSALDPAGQITQGVQGAGGTGKEKLDVNLRSIINVLLYVLGAVAVIMIVIGGLRYVLSGGDSSAVTAAKNTILYSVVGLIVAILAYAIVNFVVTSFT